MAMSRISSDLMLDRFRNSQCMMLNLESLGKTMNSRENKQGWIHPVACGWEGAVFEVTRARGADFVKLPQSKGNSSRATAFLVADTQLYKRLCPSVHWPVGL